MGGEGLNPKEFKCYPDLCDHHARWYRGESGMYGTECGIEIKGLMSKDVREALEKINAIRNSIIGCQSINWSEHIYPLVAALDSVGMKGEGYPASRENIGTMAERVRKLEIENEQLNYKLRELSERGEII